MTLLFELLESTSLSLLLFELLESTSPSLLREDSDVEMVEDAPAPIADAEGDGTGSEEESGKESGKESGEESGEESGQESGQESGDESSSTDGHVEMKDDEMEGGPPETESDSKSDSEHSVAARPAGCSPPPEYWKNIPDNQLGFFPSSPEYAPADGNEPEPEDSDNDDHKPKPLTPEERKKAYWKRFVVPWPRPAEMEGESGSETEGGSESGSGSHRDSDTWRLSDAERKHASAATAARAVSDPSDSSDSSDSSGGDGKPEDGSSPRSSFGSPVNQETFEAAMTEGSTKAHSDALASGSSKTTLETPKCNAPES